MRRRLITWIFPFLFLLTFLLQVQIAPAAENVSVQEIMSTPDKYDGQEVTIQGKAYTIKPRTSKRGKDYTTLTVKDESGKSLKVVSWGHPPLAEGHKVTVTGIFKKTKRVGRVTLKNHIEARNINR